MWPRRERNGAELLLSLLVPGLPRHSRAVRARGLQVWRAYCPALDREVAVKLLDLESVNCSLVRARSIACCCISLPCCHHRAMQPHASHYQLPTESLSEPKPLNGR